MTKIYFSGNLNIVSKNSEGEGSQKTTENWRLRLLKVTEELTSITEPTELKEYPILYAGPFFHNEEEGIEKITEKKTKEILNSDIFCCIINSNFSIETAVELTTAANLKKKIVIFYDKSNSNNTKQFEVLYAIENTKRICMKNGITIDFIYYKENVVPVMKDWLTNIAYLKRYVVTNNKNLQSHLQFCTKIGVYKNAKRGVNVCQYMENDDGRKFVVERYCNGLTIIKTTKKFCITGIVDVTNNILYLDENIKKVTFSKAILEGVDGVGKTSVVTELIRQGLVCLDQSEEIRKYIVYDENLTMDERIEKYKEYLKSIMPKFVIFLIDNSKIEVELRNKNVVIDTNDSRPYEYNELYKNVYAEMYRWNIKNPIEMIDCTGMSLNEETERVKTCIKKRITAK